MYFQKLAFTSESHFPSSVIQLPRYLYRVTYSNFSQLTVMLQCAFSEVYSRCEIGIRTGQHSSLQYRSRLQCTAPSSPRYNDSGRPAHSRLHKVNIPVHCTGQGYLTDPAHSTTGRGPAHNMQRQQSSTLYSLRLLCTDQSSRQYISLARAHWSR